MVLSELSPVNYVIFTMLYAEKKGVGLRGEWGGGGWGLTYLTGDLKKREA